MTPLLPLIPTTRTIGQFRRAYSSLGQTMASSGLLPDSFLVWFLSHSELGQLCLTGRPGLVRKAVRRRQLYPGWDARKFGEVVVGSPAL